MELKWLWRYLENPLHLLAVLAFCDVFKIQMLDLSRHKHRIGSIQLVGIIQLDVTRLKDLKRARENVFVVTVRQL
jgi:hypothetical protein